MTSANRAGAERERYDPSTADDAYAARERRDAQSGAGFVDRGEHAFKEKESDYIQEFIPSSSHTPGSGQHIREELKYLTQEGLEPDVQTTTPKPTQAFTDESTAGQSQGRGLDPTEKLQGQESERVPEDKRSDQENPQPDRETFVTQRSCDYDPEDGMPAVVVTQPEEVSSDQAEDINLSVTLEDMMHSDFSRNASPSDGTELSGSDLLSLKSDTLSLLSEAAISCKSDEQEGPEEDTRSVTASSVMGYTPLHLASLHGHDKIIQLLINNYNAKVNIRDYHGKMAAHYWSGSKDIFTEHRSHSAGSWPRGRRAQCYAQLSALLSRSQSNRNIGSETSSGPLELHPPHPDTHSSQTTAQ
ncbi:ankyrin repeat domain-containing protein SOWAHC isoform X4 [Puntigrus tetrazona]|uniref:ankyrin repeat domain-containing protein SOWAHC isoform X4 n=1 Tax=Puntigrus tetrazona TaxID=1606681 RepID=UPI001C893067|nr:ankyrin repeat domain-containing protein SOWAHC isoform X4 [Puntigrus tetrazona]